MYDIATLSYSGGIAWTEGTGHSSAGPVIIKPGALVGYAKASYEKENLYARLISNQVHLNTSFDFVRGSNGQLVNVSYDTHDYGLEAGNSTLIRDRHFLTFGGNFRIANVLSTDGPVSMAEASRNGRSMDYATTMVVMDLDENTKLGIVHSD